MLTRDIFIAKRALALSLVHKMDYFVYCCKRVVLCCVVNCVHYTMKCIALENKVQVFRFAC